MCALYRLLKYTKYLEVAIIKLAQGENYIISRAVIAIKSHCQNRPFFCDNVLNERIVAYNNVCIPQCIAVYITLYSESW